MANFFDDVLATTPDAPAQALANRAPSLAEYQKQQATPPLDPDEHVITVTRGNAAPTPIDAPPQSGGNFFSDILAATSAQPSAAQPSAAPPAQVAPAPVATPAMPTSGVQAAMDTAEGGSAPSAGVSDIAARGATSLQNANQLVGAAANGVTMGFAPRVGAAVDTATQYGDSLLGLNTAPKSYADNLATRQQFMNQAYADHPLAAPIASGAAGMMLPLGGAKAAMQGVNLGTKIVRGALTGGALGGVNSASEVPDYSNFNANDAASIGKGIGIGGAVGGSLPAVASAVGSGYTGAMNRINGRVAGIVPDAQHILTNALINDGSNAVADKMQSLGPRAMPLDAGTNLNSLALGYAGKPGNHKQALVDALTGRNATTNDVMRATVDRNMGPVVGTPQQITGAIKAARRSVHDELPAIHAAAPPVDISGVLAHIGQNMGAARGGEAAVLKKARDALMRPKAVDPEDVEELNALRVQRKSADTQDHAALDEQIGALTKKIEERPLVPVTDAQAIHNTKRMIDDTIKYGNTDLGIAPGELSAKEGAASTLRKMLRRELGAQVDGYSDAMERSTDLARQNSEYLAGRKTLHEPLVWAEDANSRFAGLPEEQQLLHAHGIRADFEDALENKENDLQAVTERTQGKNGEGRNSKKIAGVFGQPAADDISRNLTAEQLFRDNHGKILAGSMTQPRQAAAEAIKDQVTEQKELIPGNMNNANWFGTLLANPARVGVNKLYNSLQRPVDNSLRDLQIVQGITRQDDAGQELIRQLIGAANARQANLAVGNRAALATALAGTGAANAALGNRRGARN